VAAKTECRSPVRSFVVLVVVAFLASWAVSVYGGSGAVSAQERPFADFYACQELYCDQLLKFLNSPIEWHFVLDASGTYLGGSGDNQNIKRVTKLLAAIQNELPVQNGDTFCVSSFATAFYEGPCSDPVDITSLRESRLTDFLSETAATIARNSRARADDDTNFPQVISDISGSADKGDSCSYENPSRVYYFLVTDGLYDPDGTGSRSLSPPGDGQFTTTMRRFFTPNPEADSCGDREFVFRGIIFFIDVPSLGSRGPAVHGDWVRIRSGLDREFNGHVLGELVKISILGEVIGDVHRSEAAPLTRSDIESLHRAVGRYPGLIPCLKNVPSDSGTYRQKTFAPFHDYFPVTRSAGWEECRDLEGSGFLLSLHSGSMSVNDGDLELTLNVLTRNTDSGSPRSLGDYVFAGYSKDRDVGSDGSGRVAANRGGYADRKTEAYYAQDDPHHPADVEDYGLNAWIRKVVKVPVPVRDGEIGGEELPVRLEINERGEASPFLILKVDFSAEGDAVIPLWEEWSVWRKKRGRFAALVAMLAFLVATLARWGVFCFRQRIGIELVDDKKRKIDKVWTVFRPFNIGVRFRLRESPLAIDEPLFLKEKSVPRLSSMQDPNMLYIDILRLGCTVLYCIWGSSRNDGIRGQVDPVNEESASCWWGCLRTPWCLRSALGLESVGGNFKFREKISALNISLEEYIQKDVKCHVCCDLRLCHRFFHHVYLGLLGMSLSLGVYVFAFRYRNMWRDVTWDMVALIGLGGGLSLSVIVAVLLSWDDFATYKVCVWAIWGLEVALLHIGLLLSVSGFLSAVYGADLQGWYIFVMCCLGVVCCLYVFEKFFHARVAGEGGGVNRYILLFDPATLPFASFLVVVILAIMG